MARGRNSKAAVLKDDARERKIREADALALDSAAMVLRRRFTRPGPVITALELLAGQIREGVIDHTDFLADGPMPDLIRADD
jgi:hypothetical protein